MAGGRGLVNAQAAATASEIVITESSWGHIWKLSLKHINVITAEDGATADVFESRRQQEDGRHSDGLKFSCSLHTTPTAI